MDTALESGRELTQTKQQTTKRVCCTNVTATSSPRTGWELHNAVALREAIVPGSLPTKH